MLPLDAIECVVRDPLHAASTPGWVTLPSNARECIPLSRIQSIHSNTHISGGFHHASASRPPVRARPFFVSPCPCSRSHALRPRLALTGLSDPPLPGDRAVVCLRLHAEPIWNPRRARCPRHHSERSPHEGLG